MALAAAAVALIALLIAIVLAVRLRRLRAAQSAVLGAHGQPGPRHLRPERRRRVHRPARVGRGARSRQVDERLAVGRGADRRLHRLPLADPLRRLRRDVGAPVQLARAAGRPQVGRRHLVDPASRPGARVREAADRRRAHARALAGGAGGGRHRARRRRRRTPPPSVRVAFLGPAGTFTEEALRASAPGGRRGRRRTRPSTRPSWPCTTGRADRALVPIENSLEGGVAATLDALATEASDVRIVAEHIHPIHHCLIARRALDLGEVTRVISHPQAMSQCAALLRGPARRRRARVERLDRRGGARRGRVRGALGGDLVAARGRAVRVRRPARGRRGLRRQRDPLRLARAGVGRRRRRAGTRRRSSSGASTTSPRARS